MELSEEMKIVRYHDVTPSNNYNNMGNKQGNFSRNNNNNNRYRKITIIISIDKLHTEIVLIALMMLMANPFVVTNAMEIIMLVSVEILEHQILTSTDCRINPIMIIIKTTVQIILIIKLQIIFPLT